MDNRISFQRGLDPKQALKIGNEANPVEVIDLYAADDSTPEDYRTSPKSANIKEDSAKWLFIAMGEGQIRDWENRFLLGIFTGEEELMKNGGVNKLFRLHKISNYKGYWILYRNKKYKIPVK